MNDRPLKYELIRQDSAARLGRVTTRHGSFDTPAFMPVGTQGTIKGVLPDHVAATGSQIILANTYHLMLRPGEKVVAALGDLHRFMSWPGPILTDSGGFQVFSLADINRIGDEGVTFRSHIDGAAIELTPQRSIQVQNDLGADIIMAFDECPDPNKPREYQQQAVDRTLRWAEQCLAAHARPRDQSLFGIVQGGTDQQLRSYCLEKLIAMDFPGYAIGGLAVGEGFEATLDVMSWVAPNLPPDKPRYLMGVGYPRDIVAAVRMGLDMFDCVLPTRNGRNASAFTADGSIRLRNSRFTRDSAPIESGCDCYACRNFSRGAIRHFFFASEMLGPVLVSVHNIRFYQRLMADIRKAIADGTFAEFAAADPRCSIGPGVIGADNDTQQDAGEQCRPRKGSRLNWIDTLAQVTPPTTAPTTQRAPSWFLFLQQFGPLLLLGVLFYFLMFGNKRKTEKQRQDMLSQLSKGDEVVTIGGQIGKVVEARPDRVLLKVDESSNTKIWFLRSAIHRVLDDEKDKAESK